MPQVEIDDQFLYQHEHLIMGLSYALAKRAHSDREIHDSDLVAGLTSLARRYDRLLNSGLHYEEPIQGLAQQAVAAELENMVKEYRDAESKHAGFSRLRDSEVLKALVFLLRMALARTSGRPKSRAFMDFLFTQFPEKQSALASPEQASGRIIVP